jgi:hypothetical protein
VFKLEYAEVDKPVEWLLEQGVVGGVGAAAGAAAELDDHDVHDRRGRHRGEQGTEDRYPSPEQDHGRSGAQDQPDDGQYQPEVQGTVRVPDRTPGASRLSTYRHNVTVPSADRG